MGNEDNPSRNKTCDTKKGKNKIESFCLLTSHVENQLKYTKNGTIFSSDKKIDKELNDILNLNEENLRIARQQVFEALHNIKKRLNKKGKFDSGIKRLVTEWKNRDSYGMYKPFWAVGLYYLSK